MARAMKLSKVFHMIDNGLPEMKRTNRKVKIEYSTGEDGRTGKRNKTKATKKAPVCLWPPHKFKGYRHNRKIVLLF